jgi:hypothetical protein
MAGQYVGEKLLATGDALKVGFTRCEVARREPIEACRSPHPLVHLHDERAQRCLPVSPAARPVVWVAVDLHHAPRRLHDVELEGVEDEVGAEPHVVAAAGVQSRPEGVGELCPGGRVHPVGGDDEVVPKRELVGWRRLRQHVYAHPEVCRPVAKDVEQPDPAHGGEAVPAGGDHFTAVVDIDVVPAGELGLHRLVDRPIGMLDPAECLVGEHHTETEGVIGRVALPHGDLVGLAVTVCGELLGEGSKVQTAGPSPDHRDPHEASMHRLCQPSRIKGTALHGSIQSRGGGTVDHGW